ncbi:MAG: hypothetical protein H7837_01715 [Magnetococcus sp. MYC-9]
MDHTSPNGLSAAAAIQAALAAEQQAMQGVAACRERAACRLDEARRQASEITAQADTRISELHKEYNKRIRKLEETAQTDAHRHRSPEAPLSTELLLLPVAQLAAWLTGATEKLPTPAKGVPIP